MAALQEVSENWDDDFEFQVERRKMSTASAKSQVTENWDDDFEDSRQSPKKMPANREESWDDEYDDENAEFGAFAEEDRTVTSKSRRAALARLPRSLPAPHPRSPTSSVFSVPTTIHTYSSTTHLRPSSAFALIPPSPPIHKDRARRRLRKKSRPKPHGVFELADMPSMLAHERRSFSDVDNLPRPPSDLGMRRAEMSSKSDLSSVDERPPPVVTAVDTSIGSLSAPVSVPPTPTKGAALLSRIGSVKKWGARRKRGDSTAPADAIIVNDLPVEREPIISKWDPRRKRGDSTTPTDTVPTGSPAESDTQAQPASIVSYLPTPGRSRRRGGSTTPADKEKDGLRDKEKEKENEDYQHHHPKEKEKEGARSFMGSVRRISLVSVGVVGRHKKAKSGGGGGFAGVGDSPSRIPPLPCALPPLLASVSQVSLRMSTATNTASSQHSSEFPSTVFQRAVSLSYPTRPSGDSTSFAAPATPVRSASSSNSRPPSIGSSTRRRRLSKSKSKPRKSEESQELRDSAPRASLDFRQEREPFFSSERDTAPKTPTRSTSSVAAPAVPLLPPIELQPPPPHAAAIPLLPPIELQPPSPPRTTTKTHIQRRSRAYTTNELVEGLELDSLVVVPSSSTSSSAFFTPTSSQSWNLGGVGTAGILPLPPLSLKKLSPGKSSQQSVSLGRSTVVNTTVAGGSDESTGLSLAGGSGSGGGGLPRRNSLGDLKIPARISQAQVGLRRDLGMVREFASNVEQLKELQNTYNILVVEVRTLLDTHMQRVQPPQPIKQSSLTLAAVGPKASSPNFFSQLKPRPKTRARSNTNPTPGSIAPTPDAVGLEIAVTSSQVAYKSLAEAFWSINSKYRILWECAELLIELGSGGEGGGGVMSAPASVATTSASAPAMQQLLSSSAGEGRTPSLKERERTITLAGDEPEHSTTTPPQPATHNEAQTQVQSPSSLVSNVISVTGSSSMPGGMQSANNANASGSSAGPPLASPPSMSWRASTGRHDLSQRQLVLLREMLNNNIAASDDDGGLRPSPPHLSIPVAEDHESRASALSPYYPRSQFVNRDWRWGDARNSTITLSEEQESGCLDEGGRRDGKTEKEKKRRSGRLGVSGIRDMLRSLKKSHAEETPIDSHTGEQYHHHHHHGRLPMLNSTTSLSTESSNKSVHRQPQAQQQQNRLPMPSIPSQVRRRGRSSTGPESVRSSKGPSPTAFGPSSFTTPKPSPRRPSLASIFRIGGGNNNKTRSVSVGVGVEDLPSSTFGASEHDLSATQCSSATTDTRGDESNSTGEEEEEDWDRMDSASDLDAAAVTAAAKALGIVDETSDVSATVRGRKGFNIKADEMRGKAGVSPYLQHRSSEGEHHNPSQPSLPASLPSTGLGGFLARHSIIPKRSFSASQSSIWGGGGGDGPQQHSPIVPSGLSRHSNFEEQPVNNANVDPPSLRISSSKSAPITTGPSRPPNVNFSASGTPRPPSRPSSSRSMKLPNVKAGSVRSMPPNVVASSSVPSGIQGQPSSLSALPDPKLAMIMTPENIKPLLENAKEVHVKLHECIAEIRALIKEGSSIKTTF